MLKDVNVGDKIYSYNIEEQKIEIDTVIKNYKNLMISSTEEMYELTFDNNQSIKVTGNHKILTTEGYVRADHLTKQHEIIQIEDPLSEEVL